MPCLIALIVLGILSIFSASHRKMAKEAFDCVFRRITLRPCDTGFDVKVKSKVTGKLLNRSPKIAGFVNRRFELLAWIFVIVFTLASLWTIRGIYNYWAWGSCNGLNAGGFCAFDPTGENNKVSTADAECLVEDLVANSLNLERVDLNEYPTQTAENDRGLVFLGCYTCDFTRKVYPQIQELMQQVEANYTFIHFPTKTEAEYLLKYDYCLGEIDEPVYWQFVDAMFAATKEQVADEAYVHRVIADLGVDEEALYACLESQDTQSTVEELAKQVRLTGIYGTPTVFVNGTVVVGPKPIRVYRRLLTGSLF